MTNGLDPDDACLVAAPRSLHAAPESRGRWPAAIDPFERPSVFAGATRYPAALVLTIGGVLSALPVLAAAPNVREVTPAGITIDGSRADWDDSSADFLADMFEAGKPDHPVLAKLYGRYDCASRTFYVHVTTITAWVVIPSDADNYVKQGQTDKLVDGDDGTGPPPAFAYISKDGWEASFAFAPGTYTGEAGLNVHALVAPEERASTAAVADRRLNVTIVCPEPTTEPRRSRPRRQSRRHRRPRSLPPCPARAPRSSHPPCRARARPPSHPPCRARALVAARRAGALSRAVRPAERECVHRAIRPAERECVSRALRLQRERVVEPSALPSESASAAPSALPSGSAEPSGDPPLIVIKVADQGTRVHRRRRGGRGSAVRAPTGRWRQGIRAGR